MPNFSRTVTVSSDIDSAFAFLSDFRNLEKWAEGDKGELVTKEPLRQTPPATVYNDNNKIMKGKYSNNITCKN